MAEQEPIQVIDLFAGPGGLGEGFSSLLNQDGDPVFKILLSIEKDETAHKTLRLRAFARRIFQDGKYPNAYLKYLEVPSEETMAKLKADFPSEWAEAEEETLCDTLKQGDTTLINKAKKRINRKQPLVIIGGPPCQAYSLVGRARRANDKTLENDPRQKLYECYLEFIKALKPQIFVMENVKGMLSAKVGTSHVFDSIKEDMIDAGYKLHSLVTDSPEQDRDYIVAAENYGIPQARHRVILLGIKEDCSYESLQVLELGKGRVSVSEAIGSLPMLRSSLSKRGKNEEDSTWGNCVQEAAMAILESTEGDSLGDALEEAADLRRLPKRTSSSKIDSKEGSKTALDSWYRGRLKNRLCLPNHETRSHTAADLKRYLFCAAYAKTYEKSPKLWDMPYELLPNHTNVTKLESLEEHSQVKFADRFRVQLADQPARTITSHIAKDGHYYIHPSVKQCRSLTVREAARLQTFPDDYFFEGNRTQQYGQVGNAVPPLLAQQIAQVVATLFEKESLTYFDSAEESPMPLDDKDNL